MTTGSEAANRRTAGRAAQLEPGGCACPRCHAGNPEDAQFCRECGVALWEKCSGCTSRSRIGEQFCPHCGENLGEKFQQQYQQRSERLKQAEELADQRQLDDAMLIVRRLTEAPDFRFEDLADQAKELLSKIDRERAAWKGKIEQAVAAARKAFENKEYDQVQSHLEPVPRPLLGKEAERMLSEARSASDQWNELKSELKAAIENKRYVETGAILNRMLVLRPESTKYQKLAKQIADQLISWAERRFARGDLPLAAEQLEGVALCCRGKAYVELRKKVDEIFWLRKQLVSAPYVTQTLVHLATRLSKAAPSDERTAQLLEKLKTRLGTRPEPARAAFPQWKRVARAAPPHQIHAFGRFENVTCTDKGPFLKAQHRFPVALGLALQAVGAATYDIRLADRYLGQKRGGLKRLFQKQSTTSRAWGLDIGASSVKAVCVEKKSNGGIVVVASDYLPFEIPLHRPDAELRASQLVREAIQKLDEKHSLKQTPVWVDLPARQTLVRYSHLPPIYTKKNESMIAAEAQHQFPFAVDELVWDSWVAPFRPDSEEPRSLVMVATRRETVKQRLELLQEVGIEAAGVQAGPLAFANALRHEFQDLIPAPDPESAEQVVSPPALAGLDIGCESTNLVIITPAGLWFRSFDVAGDSMALAIARSLKVSYPKAQQLQTGIGKLERLSEVYEQLNPVFTNLWQRVFVEVDRARETLGDCHISQLWAFGGPSRLHGIFDLSAHS